MAGGTDVLAVVAGVVFAAVGGELFVRGVVGVAHWARIPPAIVAATIAAYATSSPELSVAVNAALAGDPRISLGDALGSNVANVALILALAVMISGLHTPRAGLRRDFPVALGVPFLTGALLLDGTLSRPDAALLLSLFAAWLVAAVLAARRERVAEAVPLAQGRAAIVLSCVGGLVLLLAAGRLIATGARAIAAAMGVDEFIIGATVVALGTSVPELATTLVARLRGHDEVGLGIILGSNVFNGLFIVGVAAAIHPIAVRVQDVAVALLFGVLALALAWPPRSGYLRRPRGGLLLALYAAYVVAIVHQAGIG